MSYTTRSSEILQAMFAESASAHDHCAEEFPAKWIDEVFIKHDLRHDHRRPCRAAGHRYLCAARTIISATRTRHSTTARRGRGRARPSIERDTLYGEAQQILAEDVPALYLFVFPISVFGTRS